MTRKNVVSAVIAALVVLAGAPGTASAAVESLPGMDTATNMKEWLKLTDAQVKQLQPIIATRIQKTDAALAKVEAAEKPDAVGFIEEYGKIKKEFNTGIAGVLTPEQAKQWESFKAALEEDVVKAGARKQLTAMQAPLQLTDDQVAKLTPPMTVAIQKKVDVLQKLADGGRISIADKIGAKRAMGDINGELEKAMSGILSPNQLAAYKQATQKK